MAPMPSGPALLMSFGKNVRALRKRQKLTQEQLAERAGLHRNYISQVERGRQSVTLTVIDRLARALGVKPAKLLS